MVNSCTCGHFHDASNRNGYRLVEADCLVGPRSLVGLTDLMRKWSADTTGKWWGKLYVAKTVFWDSDQSQFCQEGCSPNYLGGLWTLTCCKHDMRAANLFREAVKSGTRGTLIILTLSRACRPDRSQYLVSAAKVTNWFETMQHYANYLLQSGNSKLLSAKLSRQPLNRGNGRRFGDCHSNRRGNVKSPCKPHPHPGAQAERDLDGSHLLLASNCFVVWRHPVLRVRANLRQSRYGINVTSEKLPELLVED